MDKKTLNDYIADLSRQIVGSLAIPAELLAESAGNLSSAMSAAKRSIDAYGEELFAASFKAFERRCLYDLSPKERPRPRQIS